MSNDYQSPEYEGLNFRDYSEFLEKSWQPTLAYSSRGNALIHQRYRKYFSDFDDGGLSNHHRNRRVKKGTREWRELNVRGDPRFTNNELENGWNSSHQLITPFIYQKFNKRGHSQPKTALELMELERRKPSARGGGRHFSLSSNYNDYDEEEAVSKRTRFYQPMRITADDFFRKPIPQKGSKKRNRAKQFKEKGWDNRFGITTSKYKWPFKNANDVCVPLPSPVPPRVNSNNPRGHGGNSLIEYSNHSNNDSNNKVVNGFHRTTGRRVQDRNVSYRKPTPNTARF